MTVAVLASMAYRRFGVSSFWLSGVAWQLLSPFWFVVVSACRRFGLSSFLLVVVPVCRRFGVSPFRFVVVLACRRFGLSSFRRVAVSVCRRFPACRRSGLSSFWLSGVVRKLLSPFRFVVVSACRRFDCRRFRFVVVLTVAVFGLSSFWLPPILKTRGPLSIWWREYNDIVWGQHLQANS